jgi:hypothetical protein
MPAPCIRRKHNPHRLKCTYHGCKRWFKTAGGRTRHVRLFHNAEAAMHPRQPTPAHQDLNPEEAIQSSPPPDSDDAISYASSPRSRISMLDVHHGKQFINLTPNSLSHTFNQMKRSKVVRVPHHWQMIHFLTMTTIHPSMIHLHDHRHATSLQMERSKVVVPHRRMIYFLTTTTIHPSMNHLHNHQHATSLLCGMKQSFIIH